MSVEGLGTILIVDDQLSAREVLRGLLTGKGYQLFFAHNGQEALQAAAIYMPDLILLDVMMPGMDGFEVCQKIRLDPQLAEIPVVMVTALDDSESRLQGLKAGADDFITKPFDRAELQTRVQTITRLNHQRRQHRLELQAERDRTKAILEALGEAVVVTNAAGVIRYINPATTILTGFLPEETLGQPWQIWQGIEAENQRYDEILDVARTGQTWRGEVISTHKTGTVYDTALTVAPLFDPGDQLDPIGFVTVQRNITPLKKAERAKNEFVSNVSHELRTPLAVLTLVSDNLETLYDRLDDPKRLKMIRDIQKHTQILNELIGDVLEISRIDSGNVSMDRQVVDLVHLARLELNEMIPLAEQQAHTLQLEDDGPLNVLGNAAQLGQVIRNLLNNAIKYTPNHGQILCKCTALVMPLAHNVADQPDIWPGSQNLPDGAWAALSVIDTGIGVSPENLPHLFNRFYRVKTQQNIRGTGLGLSITRNLVELHHGHMAVASTLNVGTVFAIYLPLPQQN